MTLSQAKWETFYETLLALLTRLAADRIIFISTVLPATCTEAAIAAPPTISQPSTAKQQHVSLPPCVLPMLRGHEESLLKLIADFAGVIYGRPLRNVREAARAVEEIKSFKTASEQES